MASAVDSRLAYARLSAVATASRLPTANRGSNNSYTTSWDTTSALACDRVPGHRWRATRGPVPRAILRQSNPSSMFSLVSVKRSRRNNGA